MISPTVIYEDPQIIVLDKPAGLVTMPGPVHEKYEEVLAGWLLSRVGSSLKKVGLENRWGIVHRLDKDTSGLLVCAKTQKAFEHLLAQFKKREIKKEYLALVWGEVKVTGSASPVAQVPSHGLLSTHSASQSPSVETFASGHRLRWMEKSFVIDVPIARNPKNRMRFCVKEDGKPAVTEFKVLGTFCHSESERSEAEESRRDPFGPLAYQDDKLFSLLEARPLTGRTHQIRVHLKHIGHPIVGDYFYSGRKRWRFAKNVLGLSRQFLHASGLRLKLLGGTVAEFESELPEDLQTCLAQFTAL